MGHVLINGSNLGYVVVSKTVYERGHTVFRITLWLLISAVVGKISLARRLVPSRNGFNEPSHGFPGTILFIHWILSLTVYGAHE